MSPVPGRQVEHQVVELAPVHVAQELHERAGDHGAAPDQGLVGVDEEADRHDLEAVGLEAGRAACRPREVGRSVTPVRMRQRRAVDVGVEDAHLGAAAGPAPRPG